MDIIKQNNSWKFSVNFTRPTSIVNVILNLEKHSIDHYQYLKK